MNQKEINKLTLNIFAVAGIMRGEIMQKKPASFSVLEFKTLGIVSKNPKITMSKLAEYLHISSPSVTEIINKLVKNGKLKKIPDKKDRRITRLETTKKGKNELDNCLKKSFTNIKNLMLKLSKTQKKDLNKILEIIINNQKQNELTA